MRFVDDLMYAKNFRRTSLSPVPNLENATIYRLVADTRPKRTEPLFIGGK